MRFTVALRRAQTRLRGQPSSPGWLAPAPFLLLLAACFMLAGCFPSVEETNKEIKEEPKLLNVILILTDDLALEDLNVDTLKHMPNLQAFIEKGTTFDNAFVTNSLCCPSRVTILRGQYTHNHQILHNQPPLGGAERFRLEGQLDALRQCSAAQCRAAEDS